MVGVSPYLRFPVNWETRLQNMWRLPRISTGHQLTPPGFHAAWHFESRRCASASLGTTKVVDYYQRLGINAGATPGDIKAAYRKRALECHPDVVPVSQKSAAEAEFRRVSEAYAILKNSENVSVVAPVAKREETTRNHSGQQTRSSGGSSSTPTQSGDEDVRWRAARTFQQQKKSPFVRKDADRLFRDAFDGKTLDDIMFQVGVRERRASKRRLAIVAEDNASKEPAGHEEVLRRVLSNAARHFAERLAKEYGHETVKKTRFIRARGAPATPPSDALPFRPFLNCILPVGVSLPQLPVMGPTSNLADEAIEHVSHSSAQPHVSSKHVMPDGSLDSGKRATALEVKRRESRYMAHNAGQVHSYHRVY